MISRQAVTVVFVLIEAPGFGAHYTRSADMQKPPR